MRKVIVESPFAAEDADGFALRRRYLLAALRDCLLRGEAPFASHGIYPGALDDADSAERELGIAAGFAWHDAADAVVVYIDLGISRGMAQGIAAAKKRFLPVEERSLPADAYAELVLEIGGLVPVDVADALAELAERSCDAEAAAVMTSAGELITLLARGHAGGCAFCARERAQVAGLCRACYQHHRRQRSKATA